MATNSSTLFSIERWGLYSLSLNLGRLMTTSTTRVGWKCCDVTSVVTKDEAVFCLFTGTLALRGLGYHVRSLSTLRLSCWKAHMWVLRGQPQLSPAVRSLPPRHRASSTTELALSNQSSFRPGTTEGPLLMPHGTGSPSQTLSRFPTHKIVRYNKMVVVSLRLGGRFVTQQQLTKITPFSLSLLTRNCQS